MMCLFIQCSKPEDESLVGEFHLSHTPSTTLETDIKDECESTVVDIQMRHLSLDESKAPRKENDSITEQQQHNKCTGDYYPPCYISVIDEPRESAVEMKKVKELLVKYQRENPDPVQGRESSSCRKKQGAKSKNTAERGGEGYEKTIAKHGDRSFQKFYKQMLRCPNQIMRWKDCVFTCTCDQLISFI